MNKKAVALAVAVFFTLLNISPSWVYAEDKNPSQAGLQSKDVKASPSPDAPVASPVKEPAKILTEVAPTASALEPAAAENSPAETAEEVAPEQIVDPGSITVNFKGADIRTVLAYISEVAGVDIVPAPDVKGLVDLRLNNKPWKTALDIILRNYSFVYEREGDIIRVVTVDNLKMEELATQTFSLNYGKSKDVVDSIKDIVSGRGKVMYDERTNIVLVTDIPTNIYKIGQIIDKLDKKTGQVLIEARIIETVLGKDEKLGIDWNVKISAQGAKRPTTFPFPNKWTDPNSPKSSMYPIPSYTSVPSYVEDTSQWIPNPNFPAVPPVPAFIHPFNALDTVTSAFAVNDALRLSSFPMAAASLFQYGTLDFSQFKAVLDMLASRSETDTISNPRITTLNNVKASIKVGEDVWVPEYTNNTETGKMQISGYTTRPTGVVLNVTPHINDKGEIVMELVPEVTEFLGYQPVSPGSDTYTPIFFTRAADTQVMVKDGQTIFIGGLITTKNVDTRTKLPIIGDMLGDVPYLGLLFSHKDIVKKKTELIFFITVNTMASDKIVEGVPLPSKADAPRFISTQRGDTFGDKKNKKQLKRAY